ncbi:hypothetical protein A6R75_23410 [Pseudomonas aeruginosa]|nr:hypothetical protein A6R75_23410 [Pseudomonas aeruginosa]
MDRAQQLDLRTGRTRSSLFLSLLFWLPSLKFMLKALLAERCDQSCYLRRPVDCSTGKLRRTCPAVPLVVSVMRMAVARRPAARPDSIRTDLTAVTVR